MLLLEAIDLNIAFSSGGKWLPVVSSVSFRVDSGEILALVGESGCGKSISCLALTGLLPPSLARVDAGRISFFSDSGAVDLHRASKRALRRVRGGGIGYIFQEPSTSLNPVMRVGDQIAEAVDLHRPEVEDVRSEVISLLGRVGIPAPEVRADAYPHELSGGMQQRVMIAMALAGAPRLLVADEPTTALDVTIQAQILDLIDRIRRERNMGVILITHNLGVVAEIADRVAVMYAGTMVESCAVGDLLRAPAHPYAAALLAAVPRLGSSGRRLTTIPGAVPPPSQYPPGCRFFGRCGRSLSMTPEQRRLCRERLPEEREIAPGHSCRCHYPLTEDEE